MKKFFGCARFIISSLIEWKIPTLIKTYKREQKRKEWKTNFKNNKWIFCRTIDNNSIKKKKNKFSPRTTCCWRLLIHFKSYTLCFILHRFYWRNYLFNVIQTFGAQKLLSFIEFSTISFLFHIRLTKVNEAAGNIN